MIDTPAVRKPHVYSRHEYDMHRTRNRAGGPLAAHLDQFPLVGYREQDGLLVLYLAGIPSFVCSTRVLA